MIQNSRRAPQIVLVTMASALALMAPNYMLEGPLSRHMALHIVGMNLIAPMVAFTAQSFAGKAFQSSRLMWIALTAQILLLWGWHAPLVFNAAGESGVLLAAMHGSISGAAFLFWLAVFNLGDRRPWQSIAALLITGKLFCLLGALFIFAPRVLFAAEHGGHGLNVPMTLADQQLAGLLMVTACPLTYVIVAIYLSARWIRTLDNAELTPRRPDPAAVEASA